MLFVFVGANGTSLEACPLRKPRILLSLYLTFLSPQVICHSLQQLNVYSRKLLLL